MIKVGNNPKNEAIQYKNGKMQLSSKEADEYVDDIYKIIKILSKYGLHTSISFDRSSGEIKVGTQRLTWGYELNESINESVYYVSGSTPTGEGDAISKSSARTPDPAKAIEKWFDVGAKHRKGTAIIAMTRKDAIALVTWASQNKDKIEEWYDEYGCPYKLEFLLNAIDKQVSRKCMTFYETEFGDMVHPFDIG